MPITPLNFCRNHKPFLLGLSTGLILAIGLILALSRDTENFVEVPYVIGELKGDTLLHTPRFNVLYRGVSGAGASSGMMTLAGRIGFMRGPGSGGHITSWGSSAKGIDCLTTYDSLAGEATVFFDGQLLRVTQDGSLLWVADGIFPLQGVEAPTIVVDKAGHARVADHRSAPALLNPWAPLIREGGSPPSPRVAP